MSSSSSTNQFSQDRLLAWLANLPDVPALFIQPSTDPAGPSAAAVTPTPSHRSLPLWSGSPTIRTAPSSATDLDIDTTPNLNNDAADSSSESTNSWESQAFNPILGLFDYDSEVRDFDVELNWGVDTSWFEGLLAQAREVDGSENDGETGSEAGDSDCVEELLAGDSEEDGAEVGGKNWEEAALEDVYMVVYVAAQIGRIRRQLGRVSMD